MKHQIGVCSICGGAVTKYFGGMGGGESIPTCEACGAVRDTSNVCNVPNAYAPVIPMRQIIAGGGGNSGGSGGNRGGSTEPCCGRPESCENYYCRLKEEYDNKPLAFTQGELRAWNGLTFADYPDDKFPSKEFRDGAIWAEQLLKERNK